MTKPKIEQRPEWLREMIMPDSTMEPVIKQGDRVQVGPVPIAELEIDDLVVITRDSDTLTVRSVAGLDRDLLLTTLRQYTPPLATLHPLRGISKVIVVYGITRARAA